MKIKEVFNMSLKEVIKKYPELGNGYITLGCLPKVNSYLAIPMMGYGSVATNCSYKGFDVKDINIYLDTEIKNDLKARGIKIGNKFTPEVSVLMSISYTIEPKGLQSKVYAKVNNFKIVSEAGSKTYDENSVIADRVAQEILKSKDLEKYVPNLKSFRNYKVL
jgi:hypothetical protein